MILPFLFKKKILPKTHQEMRKGKKISVFVGNITDELSLDEYIRSEFSDDFGFRIYSPDGPEAKAGKLVSLEKLLEGFSSKNSFKEALLSLAKEKGISEASCAIIFYNFEYDPTMIHPKRSKKVDFLGTVDYSTV